MREKLLDAENWVVRGVSQYQLKGFVAQMEVLGVEAAVFMCQIGKKEKQMCQWLSYRKKN